MIFEPTDVTSRIRQESGASTPSAVDNRAPLPRTPPTVTLLALGLEDPTPAVRRHMLRQLGSLGPAAVDALPAVVKACGDPESEVRGEANQTLSRIMRPTPVGTAQGKWHRFLMAVLRSLGCPAI